jgi:hypothetical protein
VSLELGGNKGDVDWLAGALPLPEPAAMVSIYGGVKPPAACDAQSLEKDQTALR